MFGNWRAGSARQRRSLICRNVLRPRVGYSTAVVKAQAASMKTTARPNEVGGLAQMDKPAPAGLALTGNAIPRVPYCVLHAFPRAGAAIFVAIPAGTQVRFDLFPFPALILLCRVVPVAIRGLPIVVVLRARVRSLLVIAAPVLVFCGPVHHCVTV